VYKKGNQMYKTELLVVGNNQLILEKVLNEINSQPEWNGVAATAGEDAIEKFHQRNVDLVIWLYDIAETESRKMSIIFHHQNPDLVMIKHYAVDSGLLQNDIQTALDKREIENKPAISIVDDALKNAGLNIVIQ